MNVVCNPADAPGFDTVLFGNTAQERPQPFPQLRVQHRDALPAGTGYFPHDSRHSVPGYYQSVPPGQKPFAPRAHRVKLTLMGRAPARPASHVSTLHFAVSATRAFGGWGHFPLAFPIFTFAPSSDVQRRIAGEAPSEAWTACVHDTTLSSCLRL